MEARRWTEGVTFPPDRPLLNVSQAAPVEPPPEGLRRALAEAAIDLFQRGAAIDARLALAKQIEIRTV